MIGPRARSCLNCGPGGCQKLDAGRLRDHTGKTWRVTETALTTEDGEPAPRVPAHRAFWFGWFAQFPTTLLIK
jgi:hypothetical protein